MAAYFCSVFYRLRSRDASGVQPHVPCLPSPTRYALLTSARGLQKIRIIVPVESFGPGRWSVLTREGLQVFDEQQTWESPEAAIDAEFRQIEADEIEREHATKDPP